MIKSFHIFSLINDQFLIGSYPFQGLDPMQGSQFQYPILTGYMISLFTAIEFKDILPFNWDWQNP